MSEAFCLKLLSDRDYDEYVCNKTYEESNTLTGCFYVINDLLVPTYEDFIKYCLVHEYKIEIPEGYELITLYNIVCTTADFDPETRRRSTCRASVVYTDRDYNKVKSIFDEMCNIVNKPTTRYNKNYYCWHTEDFASNQIIHAYNVEKSYIVRKLEVS